MSNWKSAEAELTRNSLYIEELNANDGASQRIDNIKTTDTVEALKRCIATSLRNPSAWSTIAVAYAGQDLDNLNATLESFGIEDGDTIFFTRAVTPQIASPTGPPPAYSGPKVLNNLMFRDLDGKTLNLNGIPIDWKVSQVRKKLGDEKAMDTEWLRFLWSGKQLEDEKTLEYYGFQENATVHIVARLRGGTLDSY